MQGSLVVIALLLVLRVLHQAPDVRVRGLQARLFCDRTGTLTDDIIGDPPRVLWNTIIGAGEAGCASTSTLVLAVIEGPKGEYLRGVRVALSARYVAEGRHGRTVTVTDTVDLGIPGPDGLLYAPLWLSRTGCSHVRLRATVLGAAHRSVVEKTVPFDCGE
jgi:hypothetical protein